MNEIILSIVIPVYKVEDYLHGCVDSIIGAIMEQERKTEIILVNDGSPDGCGNICDEYAKKYNFIRVIHKENGGAADARNHGIKAATGKFLCFIDADDYVDNQFSKVYGVLAGNQDCQIFKFGCVEEPSERVRYINSNYKNERVEITEKTLLK